MNVDWCIAQVQQFIGSCEQHERLWIAAGRDESADVRKVREDIMADIPVIEQIADQAWPEWREWQELRTYMPWEYTRTLALARKVLVQLRRREELAENLGMGAPSLSASALHPDVWQAAESQWRHDHFGDAVRAASRSVNAALQSKVGRRDISEAPLIRESFSLDRPKPGAPRLRLMEDDESDTYRNLHSGAISFGVGCFTAIRNVLSHEYGEVAEPPQQLALEYLAAFSILARWIEDAERLDAP